MSENEILEMEEKMKNVDQELQNYTEFVKSGIFLLSFYYLSIHNCYRHH